MSLSIHSLGLMLMSCMCLYKRKHTPTSQIHIQTLTYKHALLEPAATSAVIPPDFRCLTVKRQGGWGQQAVNTGRDRKSLRTLPLWIFDEREWGLAGLCLWLNQSIACVVCVWLPTEVEINKAWTRPRQLQTPQSGTFVPAISPCPPYSCRR